MKARILIIEDDADAAELLAETLHQADGELEVIRLPSSFTRVDPIASGSLDCVLLDYGLPDSAVLECLSRVRACDLIQRRDREGIKVHAAMAAKTDGRQRKYLARLADAIYEAIAFLAGPRSPT